jgi:superfamily I DNA/RNA helicase
MECNRVWLLASTYPHTWHWGAHSDRYATAVEEKNLYYVGITRAINTLNLVSMNRDYSADSDWSENFEDEIEP